MDPNTSLNDLISAVSDKLEARARRIGIPEGVLVISEYGDGTRLLSIREEQKEGSDLLTGIVRFGISAGSAFVSVRSDTIPQSGSPRGVCSSDLPEDGWTRFSYEAPSEESLKNIALFIADAAQYEFERYDTNAGPFECCSRQYTCSIRGECVHPDQMYAKACIYRKVLESGNKY